MPIPEFFKYDIRVRERMLKRGILTDSELTKHVDSLADVADQVIEVELKQPALQKESEREARIISRSAPRPLSVPVSNVRSLENELNDIEEDDDIDDEDDDEDEDEDEIKVKAAAKVTAEKAAAAKVEPAVGATPEPEAAPAAEAPAATEEDAESDT